jgi:hypothetical protein
MRSGVPRRAAVLGTALLGLTAVVALASRAHGPGGGSTNAVSTDALLEYLLLLVLVVFGAILFAGIYLAVVAHQGGKWTAPPRASLWRTIVTLFLFLVVTFALISTIHRANLRSRPVNPPAHKPGPSPHRVPGGTPARFDWAPVAVVGGLTVLGLTAAGVILWRRRIPRKTLGAEAAEALLVALDESLDDLRAEPDARRAVIAAYARMERALSLAGLGRRRAEAPREYLARTLPAVGAGAPSVERLTALFERAKFSPHDVDATMKAEAIEALAALRDELREPEPE